MVLAIAGIPKIVHGIGSGPSSIAGAVEEQSSSTKSMQQGIEGVAALAEAIAHRIEGLVSAAKVARSCVDDTDTAIAGLDSMVEQLRRAGAQLQQAR